MRQTGAFKARNLDFTCILTTVFPEVLNTREVYQNLAKKPHRLKPEPLTFEDLKIYHPTLRIYDWRSVISSDKDSLQWVYHCDMECNEKSVRKVLKIHRDLTWEFTAHDMPLKNCRIGIRQPLSTSVDLDDLLFICARIPLCNGF